MQRGTKRFLRLVLLVASLFGLAYVLGWTRNSSDQQAHWTPSEVNIPIQTDQPNIQKNLNLPQKAVSASSSWKMIFGKEGNRDAMMQVRNLCLDGNKLFMIKGAKKTPPINVAASASEMDIWLTFEAEDISERVCYYTSFGIRLYQII